MESRGAVPSGAEARVLQVLNGTAEAVPFPKLIYETRSNHWRPQSNTEDNNRSLYNPSSSVVMLVIPCLAKLFSTPCNARWRAPRVRGQTLNSCIHQMAATHPSTRTY